MIKLIISDLQSVLKVDVLFKPSPFLTSSEKMKDTVHSNPFCHKVKSIELRLNQCRKDCFSDLHEKFKNKVHETELKICHALGQLICIPLYHKAEYLGTLLIGPFKLKGRINSHKIKEIDSLLKELKILTLQEQESVSNIGNTIGEKIKNIIIQKLLNNEDSKINPKILKGIHYLKSNLNKSPTIEEIADHIHISSSRLMHLFKEEMGQSVINYFNDLKLIEAEKYLIYTNIHINKICDLLDYKSPSYFGILFKNHSALTPLKFRKANQKLIEP